MRMLAGQRVHDSVRTCVPRLDALWLAVLIVFVLIYTLSWSWTNLALLYRWWWLCLSDLMGWQQQETLLPCIQPQHDARAQVSGNCRGHVSQFNFRWFTFQTNNKQHVPIASSSGSKWQNVCGWIEADCFGFKRKHTFQMENIKSFNSSSKWNGNQSLV